MTDVPVFPRLRGETETEPVPAGRDARRRGRPVVADPTPGPSQPLPPARRPTALRHRGHHFTAT